MRNTGWTEVSNRQDGSSAKRSEVVRSAGIVASAARMAPGVLSASAARPASSIAYSSRATSGR